VNDISHNSAMFSVKLLCVAVKLILLLLIYLLSTENTGRGLLRTLMTDKTRSLELLTYLYQTIRRHVAYYDNVQEYQRLARPQFLRKHASVSTLSEREVLQLTRNNSSTLQRPGLFRIIFKNTAHTVSVLRTNNLLLHRTRQAMYV
jgi:hypothetical protein